MRPGAGSEATGKSALDILARFRRALRFSFTRVGRRLFFKAIGNFAVLWQEIEPRAPGLHLEERREIRVAQLEADHVGHDLGHQRRHRHWNLELARGFEPEFKSLARAGNSDAEAAGAHNLWIAADRSGEKGGAELFRFRADLL